MKKIIKAIFLFILDWFAWTFIMYCLVSLTWGEINPQKWPEAARQLSVTLGLCATFFIALLGFLIPKK